MELRLSQGVENENTVLVVCYMVSHFASNNFFQQLNYKSRVPDIIQYREKNYEIKRQSPLGYWKVFPTFSK